MGDLPTLRTPRLLLRPPETADLPDMRALWADPDVTRHIGPTKTAEEVWHQLLRYRGHWALLGYGYWIVEADGVYAGEVGFGDYRRAIVPTLDGLPEIGWVLAPHAHGRGIATEAAAAALAWRDAALAGDQTVCIVAPPHTASLRVAAKLGFQETGIGSLRGKPTVILRRAA